MTAVAETGTAEAPWAWRPISTHRRGRPADRAARLDAGGVPEDAGPADRRARRTPRSSACSPRATGSPGRRRCGARRSCWPRCRTRPGTGSTSTPRPRRSARTGTTSPPPHRGPAEVLVDLQLPDAHLRRRRHHRLAGGRRRDLQPGAAVPQLLRAVRAGRCGSARRSRSTSGRASTAADHDARHRRAARDGAGRGGPVVVAVADDVRPARRGVAELEQSMRWRSSGTATTSCGSASST